MDEQSKELLHDIHAELKMLTQRLESAFVKDESGDPDFSGHKQFHIKQIRDEENTRDSKNHLFKEVLTWVFIGVMTFLATALYNGFIPKVLGP
jgi:hypothetical protein